MRWANCDDKELNESKTTAENELNESFIRWVMKGDVAAVELLLKAKADPTYTSREDGEPQYGKSACDIIQQFRFIGELIGRNQQKQQDMNEALVQAIVKADAKEVIGLLRAGADPFYESKKDGEFKGKSAVFIAQSSCNLSVREAYQTVLRELEVDPDFQQSVLAILHFDNTSPIDF